MIALFFTFFSCKPPEAKESMEVKAASAKKKEQLTPIKATTATNMSAFLDKYPTIELPITYKWNNPEQGKIFMSKPFDKEDKSKICTDHIKCASDEQLFYVGKSKLESGHTALINFIVGDFNERLILSIHDKDEKMISSEVLNMTAEELAYGYSSYLSKSFKIYRSKMFYVAGTTNIEVDSEEEFRITKEGMIEKVK